VRNHLKQYLSLKLPVGAQLWSAFVAGTPVKPTQIEGGTYRIPLAKSQIDDGGQQGFPVEVVYYMPVPKLGPVGYRQVVFPVPDAPVSRVFWSLYLPEKYRFLYFGGDMEKGRLASPLSSVMGRAIVSDELSYDAKKGTPAARDGERFRKDLDEVSESFDGSVNAAAKAAPASVAHQEAMEKEMLHANTQQLVQGVFPIGFDVPASGQLFHFGQVMIVGQEPHITMTYVHVTIVKTLIVILLGLLIGFIVRSRALLIESIYSLLEKIRSLEAAILRRTQQPGV